MVPSNATSDMHSDALPRISLHRVDFGDCILGETVTRTIPLSCNVPIQFGFEIKVMDPHPDMSISPLKGIIPPSGTIDVVVSFRPAALRMCKMEIEVPFPRPNACPVCDGLQLT